MISVFQYNIPVKLLLDFYDSIMYYFGLANGRLTRNDHNTSFNQQ